MPDRTPPLEGDALFAQLSGRDDPPQTLDGELVDHLRSRLEAAAVPARALPDDVVVRVSKAAVERVRRCEARHLAEIGRPTPVTVPLVRGRLLDVVFQRVVATGDAGADPWAEAVAGCAGEDDDQVAGALAALSADELAELRGDVLDRTEALLRRWPAVPARVGLRTQERSAVRLAGGRVVLTARPDVTFGRVLPGGSRVCLVEAKSGTVQPSHHGDLRFYALVEALRWGAPPQRASTYALGDGRVSSLVPDEHELVAAADTAADAVSRLVRLAAGGEPRRDPSALCPSCPLVDGCPEGRRQLALTHGTSAAAPDDWDDRHDDEEDDAA